jgi:5-amino-6-(5-phosphoribosylamino)uracil reductase
MNARDDAADTLARAADPDAPVRLRRLLPGGEPVSAGEFVDAIDLAAHAPPAGRRPYVMLNMVSTVDGRASLDGRSGALGNGADRELFHALRAAVDGVLVGAGTIRAERYGPMIRDEAVRARRLECGLREQPLACIVSGRLALPSDAPLLADAASRVAILTPSSASLSGVAAQVEYVRAERDGALDLPRALAELRERCGVRTLLCEGGPHLNAELLLAGLVDELFLSLSPMLAGGEDVSGESLRIIAGRELDEPLALELLSALEHESHLFLRYGVRGAAPARG